MSLASSDGPAEESELGKGTGIWTTEIPKIEPHVAGFGGIGGPTVYKHRGRSRVSQARVEAMQLNSARMKRSVGATLSERDKALLTKYPDDMDLDEIEYRIIQSEVEVEPNELVPAVEADEDESEDIEVPEIPRDVPADTPDSQPSDLEQEIEEEDRLLARASRPSHPMARDETPPREILRMLLDRWKMRWADWEPETLFSEIETVFGAAPAPKVQEKILALSLLLQTPSFWQDWQVFQAVTATFSGRQARFDDVQAVTLDEIDAAMRLADTLGTHDYSDDVLAYIAGTARSEGFAYLPHPMDRAQEILTGLTEEQEELRKDVSKEWERYANLDPDVAAAMDLGETPVGVHVARLLATKSSSRDLAGF